MRVALLLSIVSCFIFAGGVDGLPVGIETVQAATVKPPPKYVKSKAIKKKPVKAKAKKSLKLHKKPARKSASAKARASTKKTSLIKPKTKSAKPVKSKAKPKRNLKYQRKPLKTNNSPKSLKSIKELRKAYKSALLTKKLPGPTLPAKIASTFKGGKYNNRQLTKDTNFYKYHGIDNRTGKKYSWVTNKKYKSESKLRSELAIRRDWGVKITNVTQIKAPKGTWVSEGSAAAQGRKYPGGGYQAVISNIPKSWIIKTNKAFQK